MTYLSLSTDKLVFVNVLGRAYENNLTCLYDVFSLFS
jgi:hypothetical protein